MVLGSCWGESPRKCEGCAKVPLFGLSFISANWNSTMLADRSQSCFRTNPLGSVRLVHPQKERTGGVNPPDGWALKAPGSLAQRSVLTSWWGSCRVPPLFCGEVEQSSSTRCQAHLSSAAPHQRVRGGEPPPKPECSFKTNASLGF